MTYPILIGVGAWLGACVLIVLALVVGYYVSHWRWQRERRRRIGWYC